MRRAFTTREKVLLVILAVLVIGVGYFKLLLEPINNHIEDYQNRVASEQDEILQNTAKLARMNQMKKELEAIFDSGDARPLPAFSNSDQLLIELNTILSAADDCSLNFGATSVLDGGYIVRRPLSLTFKSEDYAQVRRILNKLHDSDNINQISDLSIRFDEKGVIETTLTISYFELME